ncbi:hypothetical protein AB4Z38_02760 [Arthrobacter sp. 2RAF6]|uniref:hypothetical protein n=1 Tax=Arthrobacter sp. 2RAF6 TaxID=3233002 RepID=UPI003F8EAD71
MNPSPSPLPVTVVAAPPEWWQILSALSPLAVLAAAIVAAVVGLLSLRQKARADDRSEWWRRAQWALDASLSRSRSEAEMGQKAIDLLGRSELASSEELALLKIGTEDALEAADKARRMDAHDVLGVPGTVRAELIRVDEGDNAGDNGGDINGSKGRQEVDDEHG